VILGNSFPLNMAQGPTGLDPTRYALRQEREDSHKEPRIISGVWNHGSNQQ